MKEKASTWHSTKEGLKWHSEHAKNGWKGRIYHDKNCQHCGANYKTPFKDRSRYCSRECILSAIKETVKRDGIIRKHKRLCNDCGNVFLIEAPSSKQKFCSRSCYAEYRVKK